MATTKEPRVDRIEGTQVPDWEIPAPNPARTRLAKSGAPRGRKSSPFAVISEKFNEILPAHKTYFGRSRRAFLLTLSAIFLVILALIIGLSVGLSRKHSGSQNLPLPSNAEAHTGDLTYYGPGLGACGHTSTDDDDIVSVSHYIFDAVQKGSDPNQNPLCGLKIRATRWNERINAQRSVDLTVVDRCTGCQPTDLDTSPGVFDKLAARASGRVDVTWAWLSPVATGS